MGSWAVGSATRHFQGPMSGIMSQLRLTRCRVIADCLTPCHHGESLHRTMSHFKRRRLTALRFTLLPCELKGSSPKQCLRKLIRKWLPMLVHPRWSSVANCEALQPFGGQMPSTPASKVWLAVVQLSRHGIHFVPRRLISGGDSGGDVQVEDRPMGACYTGYICR